MSTCAVLAILGSQLKGYISLIENYHQWILFFYHKVYNHFCDEQGPIVTIHIPGLHWVKCFICNAVLATKCTNTWSLIIAYIIVHVISMIFQITITGINPEAILVVGDHHDHPLCPGLQPGPPSQKFLRWGSSGPSSLMTEYLFMPTYFITFFGMTVYVNISVIYPLIQADPHIPFVCPQHGVSWYQDKTVFSDLRPTCTLTHWRLVTVW